MIKKILKYLGFTLLFLIILIVLLPIIFKGTIVEKVKEEANNSLNAKVDFGEFDLGLISTFPNFEFSINDVTVDGVDQFEGVQLASIKNLTLKVDLMSVISGDEINVKTLSILDLNVNALVLADSTANWDIVKVSDDEVAEETTEEASSFKLGLKDLSIINANITYVDETMDLTTTITNFNFNMSGDMTEDVTDLVTKTTIEALDLEMESIKYFKKAKIEATATIKADLANNKYTFSENEFKINELTLGLDGWVAIFEDNDDIDMDIKFGAKKTAFKNILSLIPAVYMTDFSSVKTAGKLQLDGYAKGIYTETALPAFGLDLIVEDAMFKYPDLPKAVNNIQVDLHVDNPGGSEDNTFINLKRFYMEIAGNPIDMNMKIKTPISDPDIDGGIKAKFSLASLKDVIPMEEGEEMNGNITADVRLKGKVSALEEERYEEFTAEGQLIILDMDYKSDSLPYDILLKQMYLNFSPQAVELSSFEAQIGKSDINANGKMENFIAYAFADDEALKGRFNLSSNLMDLNEFMEEEVEVAEGAETAEEEPLSVIEIPKNIDFILASSMKKVIYDNMEIDNLNGELIVKDQKVSMNNLAMNLLGGSMVMNGYYETTNPKKPGFSYDMDINDFDIETVTSTFNTIDEMAPYAKNMKGRFNTSLIVNGVLDQEMMPDLNTLIGNGEMLTKNMKVDDFKALNKLADILKNDKFSKLEIDDTKIKYSFKDGRIYTEPFDIKMGTITGTMSGSNGFDQTMDNVMTLKVPTEELGAGDAINKLNEQAAGLGMSLKDSKTVDVDVTLKGTVDNPKVGVNLKNMTGSIVDDVKEQVEEKIEEIKDDAKKIAREQADKLLKEAKAQSEKLRAEGKKAGDRIRKEGKIQGDKLIKDAGSNPFKKGAAKIAAKEVIKQADKQANKAEAEANKQADIVDARAKKEADKIMADVESK
ncbi:MAG: AsmA family protein [Flavobacteriales bacterium]|nr:AsmA family protein [Flavobacteriales bacterium]